MDDVLLHSVLEFVLVLATFDVAVGHYTHDLLVVIQDGEAWQLGLLVEEGGVAVGAVLVLGICLS